jgi:hypothetical protein
MIELEEVTVVEKNDDALEAAVAQVGGAFSNTVSCHMYC